MHHLFVAVFLAFPILAIGGEPSAADRLLIPGYVDASKGTAVSLDIASGKLLANPDDAALLRQGFEILRNWGPEPKWLAYLQAIPAQDPDLTPKTLPLPYNSLATYLAGARTAKEVREACLASVTKDWAAVALWRSKRLFFLRTRFEPMTGLEDFRFDGRFDGWRNEYKAMEEEQKAFDKAYSAYAEKARLLSGKQWRRPAPAFDSYSLPFCFRDVARLVRSSKPPDWGYEEEIRNQWKTTCTKEVLQAESDLGLQANRSHEAKQIILDVLSTLNDAAAYVSKVSQVAEEIERSPSCLTHPDVMEQAECLASFARVVRPVKGLLNDNERLNDALREIASVIDKPEYQLSPMKPVLAQWSANLEKIRTELEPLAKKWEIFFGVVAWNPLWDGFSLPAPAKKSGWLRLKSALPDLLIGTASKAWAQDASLRYGVPTGDFKWSYQPHTGGGMPPAWGEYLSRMAANTAALREAAVTNYPKLAQEHISWRETQAKAQAQQFAKVQAEAEKLSKEAATSVRNSAQSTAKRQQDTESSLRSKYEAALPKAPLFNDKPLFSHTTFNEFLASVPAKDETSSASLRSGAVTWMAAALAGKGGDSTVEQDLHYAAEVFKAMATDPRLLRSLTPGVSWAQDIWEAATGTTFEKETLDKLDRGFAILGTITGGIASKGKLSLAATAVLGRIAGKGETLVEGLKIAESALSKERILFAEGKNWRRSFLLQKIESADEVNSVAVKVGHKAPYAAGSRIYNLVTKEDRIFVRVHGTKNPTGLWMARKESLLGLTPEQVKVKLNLPHVPEFIQEVHVPKGSNLRRGLVGDNPFGKSIGPIQYEILDNLPASSFGKSLPIGKIIQ